MVDCIAVHFARFIFQHVTHGEEKKCELCTALIVVGTVGPKSKQGNTTNLNISFFMKNEKRAAQVRFEPTTYCLRGRCSTH